MKTFTQVTRSFFVLLLSVLLFFSAKSQIWQPLGPDDFNLPSYNIAALTTVAVDAGAHPYVAYRDGTSGNVYVKKFNGSTWEFIGTSPTNTLYLAELSLALDASGTPYIVYQDAANGNKATVKKFDGSNWVSVGSPGISTSTAKLTNMAIDASGKVYVAYNDVNIGGKIMVRVYTPGSDWADLAPATGLSKQSAMEISMTLDANGRPNIAYWDAVDRLCVVKYNGAGWEQVGPSSIGTSGTTFVPSIAVDGTGIPYLLYNDVSIGKGRVKKFDGSAWVDVGAPGISQGQVRYTEIKLDGTGNPYIIYSDLGKSQITVVKKFDGTNWIDAGTNVSVGPDSHQSMTFDANGTPYIAFTASSYSNKAVVKKLTGNTWVNMSPMSMAEVPTRYFSMATTGTGVPYIIYQDLENNTATVKMYNGSNWVAVGQTGFTANAVTYTAIGLDAGNTPYVFYTDQVNGATVQKYDGSNWVNVGAPGFAASLVYNSILIDAGGTPYVAYQDFSSNQINVKKFDGSNWVSVGAANFSIGTASNISMALDAFGTPWVTYCDAGTGNRVMVKKFDGTNWVDAGAPGITAGIAYTPTIAIDGAGTPYVSYIEGTTAYVKQFDGSNWVEVGTQLSGTDNIGSVMIGIDKNNNPYVVYSSSVNDNLTVKWFNGSNWVNVGMPGIASSRTNTVVGIGFGVNSAVIAYVSGGIFVRSIDDLSILPLRLTAFNGHIENADARLNWKTESEENTRSFIIERSIDGRYYTAAGTVQAANETGVHQYSFTDKNVNQLGVSTIYYRLKQVDMDGKSTYSRILMLPVDVSASRVVCYPNPVISETSVTITLSKAEKVQARLINNIGQVLQVQNWELSAGSTSLPVNMTQLAKGLYYLEINSRSIKKQIGLVKQ